MSEIQLFFDRNRILIPQDIDDVFNATTQSLDEIIRQAALMQEIGVDQLNQIEGLQTLLGESLDRTNALNQDLIRVHDDFTYERNARRHWETIAQQNQARIAGIQIANLGIHFLNRRKDAQLANQQNQLNVGEEDMQVVYVRHKTGKNNIGFHKPRYKHRPKIL
ncbi:unnamed protein product [Rhizophagus irregularis]|nr:unnamed protein product [Rhizophagus irregularis]